MNIQSVEESIQELIEVDTAKILFASFEKNDPTATILDNSGLDYDQILLDGGKDNPSPVFNFMTLKPALDYASESGFSLVIGSDSKNERITLAVKKDEKSGFVILNSHQLAAILLNIWKESGKYEDLVCLKSIHTSDLVEYMAIKSGLKLQSEIIEPGELRNSLTEVQKTYPNSTVCAFNIDQQVCHSDLDFSQIILEIAQKENELVASGQTFFDYLMGIYHEFGFYKEKTITVDLNTDAQRSHLLSIMDNLRKNPKSLESTFPLNSVTDYKKGVKFNILTDKVNSFAGSSENILKIESANNLSVTFAPSKTKMVYYISIKGGFISKEKYVMRNKEMDAEILRVIQMFNRGL
jgi:phosphomannomutase